MSLFEDPEICRTVLESMQSGIYLVDRSEESRFWNEGAERITETIDEDHRADYAERRQDSLENFGASTNSPECSPAATSRPVCVRVTLAAI
jgi:PAS domain-containing protein